MFIYRINIQIKAYKAEELFKSMHSFSRKIRKQIGCLGYHVYRDSEEENTCTVQGEWKSRRAMEDHFKTKDFQVALGAARVLGETFDMSIAEISETGGFEFAKGKTAKPEKEGKVKN